MNLYYAEMLCAQLNKGRGFYVTHYERTRESRTRFVCREVAALITPTRTYEFTCERKLELFLESKLPASVVKAVRSHCA